MRATTLRGGLAGVVAIACACPPAKGGGDTATGATTGASATTADTTATPTTAADASATATTGGPGTTGTSADSSIATTTGCSFLCDKEDLPPDWSECNPWIQDCPEGEKCSPAVCDGGSVWNRWRCVPLAPAPRQLLEPCTIDPDRCAGGDDCDEGLRCWNGFGDTSGEGYCLAFCSGPEEDPVCPVPEHHCWIGGAGFPSTCVVTCDPLAPACPLGENCVDLYGLGQAFVCLGPGPAATGEGCANSLHCAAGLLCLYDPDCPGGDGCCAPYCDLNAPTPCAPELPDAKCLPYFGDDPPPPGYEHLGACDFPP